VFMGSTRRAAAVCRPTGAWGFGRDGGPAPPEHSAPPSSLAQQFLQFPHPPLEERQGGGDRGG
jgi:hypothetical protein